MAHIHRLIAVALLAFPLAASADWFIPVTNASGAAGEVTGTSLASVCAAFIAHANAKPSAPNHILLGTSKTGETSGHCDYEIRAGSTLLGQYQAAASCRGQKCDAEDEEPPKTADEKCGDLAALYNSWSWAGGREGVVDSAQEHPLNEPFKVCMSNSDLGIGRPGDPPGCMHNFTATMRGTMDPNVPGMRYWGDSWMVGPVQGQACVPGLDGQPGDPPNVPPAEPQGPCKGFEGSVNGVDVCIDPSSGYTEGIDWTQVTDAQGNIKEQKTEIKCEGEKCTIQTTLKDPGGTDSGKTTTTTTTRGAYCAKNPESAVCKGDDDTTGSTRNQNGRGGRIDMSDALGGGGCISDLSISVMGQSISLPISVICPYLAMLGNVLVAVSLLLAVRIVGRG